MEGGWELRYFAIRTGSVSVRPIHAFKISDANISVGDTLQYAIKILLKKQCFYLICTLEGP